MFMCIERELDMYVYSVLFHVDSQVWPQEETEEKLKKT